MTDALVEIWRKIIIGDHKSWVLFKNGTGVILVEPDDDLAAQAIGMMKKWGPVHPGSSAGDFGVITLNTARGWAVQCHHEDIFTYVGPDELDESDPSDLAVGYKGRGKRDQDARELEIIHIEDKRSI